MTRLYLVRHPPVAVPDGVCYGATDVALAPGWREGAERSIARIDAEDRACARVVASPLSRCTEPASVLGRAVRTDPRLRELDFGDWELRSWAEIGRPALDAWARDLLEHAPPGGEALGALDARAGEFLAGLRGDGVESAIAFTHAGVIRCILARVLGVGPERAFRIAVDLGSVSLAVLDDEVPQIRYVNR